MKKLLLSLLLLPLLAFAEQPSPLPAEQCKSHVPYGFPTVKKQDVTPICRGAYYTVHDNKNKIPLYSAYLLKPAQAVGCGARDSTFEVDRSLPPLKRSGNKDYAKSGMDIGHMVNAEDLKYDQTAQDVAALLSNAAPQLPEFNRGIWKKLEDTTRGWALSRRDDILVYVGPITTRQDSTIGKGFVTVPHGFFKILVDTKTSEVQVFVFKNEGSKAPLSSFLTSLADVQKQTGIVFPMPVNPKFAVARTWPVAMKTNIAAKRTVCSLQLK